jgi:heme-degrading monooxygenase HmoA
LHGICPNCGGELVVRPRRPPEKFAKHPASTAEVRKEHDVAAHQAAVLQRLRAGDLPPQIWTVAFANQRTGTDDDGYQAKAAEMDELAARQPGYLGIDAVRGADGKGITVSRWSSIAALVNWRAVSAHRAAQSKGRANWYASYRSDVGRVDRFAIFDSTAH